MKGTLTKWSGGGSEKVAYTHSQSLSLSVFLSLPLCVSLSLSLSLCLLGVCPHRTPELDSRMENVLNSSRQLHVSDGASP